MKELLTLYLTFCKVGAVMFGGGYAMLPILTRELVDRRAWTSEPELLDYFAIAQCTPGTIAINTATFVGYKRKGILGGAAATLGVMTVPLLIVLLIVSLLLRFWHLPVIGYAFSGIRVAVAALIATTVFRMVKSSVKDVFGAILCALGFIVVAVLGASPIFVVLGAALAGVAYGRVRK